MNRLRRVLIAALRPIIHLLGWATRGRSTFAAFHDAVVRVAHRGDVLLVYSAKSPVGALLPGRYSHVALFDGSGVVEAVYPAVRRASLITLCEGADEVAVVRPQFTDVVGAARAVWWAAEQIGKPYDTGFGPGKAAFYCSELVWHAYREAVPSWDFEARSRLGVATVSPQDLFDATKHFETIAIINRNRVGTRA